MSQNQQSFSFKLLIQTVPVTAEEPIRPQQTNSSDQLKTLENDNELKINLNFSNLGLDAQEMEMHQIIRFRNQSECMAELRKQLKLFENNRDVRILRKKSDYKQTITLLKTFHAEPLPDYVISSIAKVLAENYRTTEYSALQKNSPFTQEQSDKLAQTIQAMKDKGVPQPPKASWFSSKTSMFLALVVGFFLIPMTHLIAAVALLFCATKLTHYLLKKNAQSYTPEQLTNIANKEEENALHAGFKEGYSALISHLKHPLALLAGKTIADKGDPTLLTIFEKPDNPRPMLPLRDLCFEAAKKRLSPASQVQPVSVPREQPKIAV